MPQLIGTIKVGNTLGENVLWNAIDQSVWWTDIEQKRLYRLAWPSKTLEVFATPERLCSFAFVHDETRILAAFDRGLAMYDYREGIIDWLFILTDRLDGEAANTRLNDGRVDPQGRYWVGSMSEANPQRPVAKLFRIGRDGSPKIQEQDITIANGICWSFDSTLFYFADSASQTIYVYDFDAETGSIVNRRIFTRTPKNEYPDGAVVDRNGGLWSAHWGGARVVRYLPVGKEDLFLALPVSQPTCVTFGGPDMDLLFVTSASYGLSRRARASEPQCGDLFIFKTDFQGSPAEICHAISCNER